MVTWNSGISLMMKCQITFDYDEKCSSFGFVTLRGTKAGMVVPARHCMWKVIAIT